MTHRIGNLAHYTRAEWLSALVPVILVLTSSIRWVSPLDCENYNMGLNESMIARSWEGCLTSNGFKRKLTRNSVMRSLNVSLLGNVHKWHHPKRGEAVCKKVTCGDRGGRGFASRWRPRNSLYFWAIFCIWVVIYLIQAVLSEECEPTVTHTCTFRYSVTGEHIHTQTNLISLHIEIVFLGTWTTELFT